MTFMKRVMTVLVLCAASLSSLGTAAESDVQPLELAVFPYLSTRAVLTTYEPLQHFLERRLGRKVLLITAPDMRTFLERTQRGEYSYVVTAPHFARLAQMQAGYVPLIRVERNLYGLLVVDKKSRARSVADLRGKVVATPDALAIISMLGVELLRKNGLEPGRDVTVRATASHNSAVLSVQRGDAAAAVTSATALKQMPDELRESVRTLASTEEVPHLMFLANANRPPKEVAEMTRLLFEFVNISPEGRQFLADTGYEGFRKPTAQEMRNLDPFVLDLRQLIGADK
jgi:phosphonate transport system substrate-binding protein